jgi:putative ABC transport system permease protein
MKMNFVGDLLYGAKEDLTAVIRSLRKDYAFTLVAVFTLAIAIGANSAIFSLVSAVLLRPLPYDHPDRIVRLWESHEAFTGSVSWPNLEDWRQQNTSFEALTAIDYGISLTLRTGPNPQHLSGAAITGDFFKVLGIQPLLGRAFLPAEDQPGSGNLVILSEGLWRTQFDSDPNVIGRTVTLNSEPHTVVAVMPAFVQIPADVQAWIPLAVLPKFAHDRGEHRFEVLGRLKPQVSLGDAQREMALIARRIEQQYPDIQEGRTVQIVGLQEQLVRSTRPVLLALFGAVGFVLLIACANVANLLLARATARRRETAIRTALGASRGQLLRHFLTESLGIALFGGILGTLLAKIAMASLVIWAGRYLPRAQEVVLDWRVLLFALVISTLTGLLCGIVPGLQSSKADIQLALKQGGTSAGSPQSNWATGLLATGEIAAAIVLLICAGLLMRTVLRLQQVDPGLQVQNIVTMKVSLSKEAYNPAAAGRFYTQLQDRVAQLPGVQAAGLITKLPVETYGYNGPLHIEGLPFFLSDPAWATEVRFVTPGYFHAFNIPLIRGRELSQEDLGHGGQSAIINQKFAQMIAQYGDPLGKHVLKEFEGTDAIAIVGVVGNVRGAGLDAPVRPEIYFLNDTSGADANDMNLVVRTAGDPTALVSAISHELVSQDANQTVYDVKTMQTVVDSSISSRRFTRTLIMIFALLGTILAVVGVYSVLSYLVTQHNREIGIRLALGAQRFHVVGMVLKQGAVVGLLGLALGTISAFALTRWLSTLLFGVKSYDALTFIGASCLLFVVVLVASYVPARRTARVDPMIALRQD